MNQAIDQSQLPIASEPVAVPRGTLKSIQMLRGLAASVVIVGHLCRAVHDYGLTAGSVARFRGFAEFGASGVDVFFVISGFIMIVTTERTKPLQRSSVTFLKKRRCESIHCTGAS